MRIHLSGPTLACALAGALFAGSPATGTAQVVNPTIAEFTPSPDHSRLASDGTAWVTRYDLGFYLQGASSPFQVASLGKPAPATDGQIRISLSTLTLPSTGIVYQARVIAVGPGGSTPSAASNTFTFATPCTYTVMPQSHTLPAGAWSGAVDVATGTTCGWTAVSNHPSWLGFDWGATNTSGTGAARVPIHVLANTGTSERTGTFTIAGHTVTIRQASASCTFGVSPTSLSVPAAGGTVSVRVTAPAGCAWTASASGWLTVSPASGSGDATIAVTAAGNTTAAQRTASLTVAGQTVRVDQNSASSCAFAVNQTAQAFSPAGGQGSLSVTTSSTCTWSAAVDSSWITVSSTSRTGSGSVSYSVAANPLGTPRSGTLTVAGQAVRIDQAGVPCQYTVNPTSVAATSQGGPASVQVSGPAGCQWSASNNGLGWITISSGGGGTVAGPVNFTIAPNQLSVSRTGTLTVAGQTVTVTQAAAPCAFVVTPTSHTIAAGGGTALGSVTTTNACAWTTANTASWLTVGGSRSGTGDYTLSATPNTTASPRSAVVTIAGTAVSVTQSAGASCQVSVSSSSMTVDESLLNNATVQVTAASGCAWTASSSAPWLTVRSGSSGSGNGTVTFRVEANTIASSRTATLTIGGQAVTVTQAAANLPKGPKRVRIISTR